MLERQSKRARELEADDKGCKTPSCRRVARRAKVVGSPTDTMPLASMHDYVARALQQPINPSARIHHPHQLPIHGFNTSFMLNPYHAVMSVNLHLPSGIHPPPPARILEHGEIHMA
jgi:hypothetical protein